MWSHELLFCLGHCIVHWVKAMEELKMNLSEIFNFALRRRLYFTWCNNLWTIQKFAFYRRSHCIYTILGWYDSNLTVQILWHVNLHCVLHNISQFSLPISCRFMDGKVRENVEALFSLFSKYKLFVYGIEMWTKTARLIFFLFDLCGLELPAINDAPVRQCILLRVDGTLFKLISG